MTFEACVRADLLWETLRRQVEQCISPASGPTRACRCSYCQEAFEKPSLRRISSFPIAMTSADFW